MEKKVLTSPALYISYFLKSNRIEYYDRMTEVKSKGNYEQWIMFFLRSVAESAEDAIIIVNVLHKLQEENYAKLDTIDRTRTNAAMIFEYIKQNPFVETQKQPMLLGQL